MHEKSNELRLLSDKISWKIGSLRNQMHRMWSQINCWNQI